jgi:hypothetical protein
MPERTIERILAEWRVAEARMDGEATDPELVAIVERLRAEHAAALKARDDEAKDLARPPGSRLVTEP